jgi:hypothetical protein
MDYNQNEDPMKYKRKLRETKYPRHINGHRIEHHKKREMNIFRLYRNNKGRPYKIFKSTVFAEAELAVTTEARNMIDSTKRCSFDYRGMSVNVYLVAEEMEYILSHIADKPYYPDTVRKLKKKVVESYEKERKYVKIRKK